MLIPKYWAQYKQRFDSKTEFNNTKKQATIKRYGWSDISEVEALSHAKQRVDEAHNRWLAGKDITRRERKEQYNDSNGIPIREQIIAKQSFSTTQLIVTRNSYGAQVANVDNIAIIDIDTIDLLLHIYPNDYSNYDKFISAPLTPCTNAKPSESFNDRTLDNDKQKSVSMKLQVWGFVILFIIIASVIAWQSLSWLWLIGVMLLGTTFLWWQASKNEQVRYQENQQKYEEHLTELLPFITDLIKKRITSHPNEQFRLYETPAGFRIMATHDTFLPSDSVVAEWFTDFHVDANYARLCQVQQCFRARLTAKPWRMTEVNKQHKLHKDIPAKNFWFINSSLDDANFDSKIEAMDEEQYDDFEQQQAELIARQQWIENYDKCARGYRACRYVESFSGSEVASKNDKSAHAIETFIQWHDSVCQVNKELPMA